MKESRTGTGGPAEGLTFLPSADEAANDDDLAQVVGVVVRDEQGFAKNRLTCAVGNAREEVGLGIYDQLLHRCKVSGE